MIMSQKQKIKTLNDKLRLAQSNHPKDMILLHRVCVGFGTVCRVPDGPEGCVVAASVAVLVGDRMLVAAWPCDPSPLVPLNPADFCLPVPCGVAPLRLPAAVGCRSPEGGRHRAMSGVGGSSVVWLWTAVGLAVHWAGGF